MDEEIFEIAKDNEYWGQPLFMIKYYYAKNKKN